MKFVTTPLATCFSTDLISPLVEKRTQPPCTLIPQSLLKTMPASELSASTHWD